LQFIGEYRFDRLGAFRYSHEENTYAALKYEDDVPERTKEKRVAGIMKLQQEISAARNASMVGREMQIIIDRREGLFHVGRSQHDSPEVAQAILVTGIKNIEPAPSSM
jgi:ribosomal protein S12 methylthiotransferase